MQLEQKSLDAFLEAVKKLDAGFAGLPAFESKAPGIERISEALAATAERLLTEARQNLLARTEEVRGLSRTCTRTRRELRLRD